MGLVMDVLLDTCAFIWLCSEPEKYSDKAGEAINKAGDLFLSDASILEMAIKHASGKLSLPDMPRRWISEQVTSWSIVVLPLSQDDIFLSAELLLHHKDPFDRLIIATAANHSLTILTNDKLFDEYDVRCMSVAG